MRVAVPLFGEDVAPRFGFADNFLVADIEDKKVTSAQRIENSERGWANRLNKLRKLGVEVLLCGGFNRSFIPLAEDLGIGVLAGLAGDAFQAVAAFARGDSMPTLSCHWMNRGTSWRRCRKRGHGGRRGGNRHTR